MRYLLGKASEDEEAVELLEDFLGGAQNTEKVLSILGIDTGLTEPLEEISSMAAGAMEMSPAPIKKKKKPKRENKLVNEIFKLIMERGILNEP